jgi:hypothetical protein
MNEFELLLERLHADFHSRKKVCCLQHCEALHLVITNSEMSPKRWRKNLQNKFI